MAWIDSALPAEVLTSIIGNSFLLAAQVKTLESLLTQFVFLLKLHKGSGNPGSTLRT